MFGAFWRLGRGRAKGGRLRGLNRPLAAPVGATLNTMLQPNDLPLVVTGLSARPARALCQRLDGESAGKPIRTPQGARRASDTDVPSELFRHLGLLPTHTGDRLVDAKAHPYVLLEAVALGAHQSPQSSGVGDK